MKNFEDKILDLDTLVSVIPGLQDQGKKVIHCHGVFDLIHVGHIKHFQEARSKGDILVITLTADEHVNKGPNRPVFTSQLRALALASQESIDYVAVNHSADAVELIKKLKANAYVKGADYKDFSKDKTGGILREKEAIESVGGELIFTDDEVMFSSSSLLNAHINAFPNETQEFIGRFREKYNIDDISKYLDKAKDLKVLILGETIIDVYQYCSAIGKSSKEPTLAVKQLNTEVFAGGALSVANHVSNFTDSVKLMSILGDDSTYDEFIKENLNDCIQTDFIHRENSPTIEKKRLIDDYYFTKVLEIYNINESELEAAHDEDLCRRLESEIDQYDLVIVCDFGHSMFTPNAIKIICEKSQFLALNVQSNAGNMGFNLITKYPRTDFLTLAQKELRLAMQEHKIEHGGALKAIVEKLGANSGMVTMGDKGCQAYEAGSLYKTPALAQKVVDRVGAGDALLSVCSLLAVQKAPLEMTAFVGNAVGAEAVSTVCNKSSINKVTLQKHLEALLK
jgi:rfaE bifunctional protein nucleotidyltransferase chain/domain